MKTVAYQILPGREYLIPWIVDLPKIPGLKNLTKIVRPLINGGELEHLVVFYQAAQRDLFIDRDATQKDLPPNRYATRIAYQEWRKQNPEMGHIGLAPIQGPAVFFQRKVWL